MEFVHAEQIADVGFLTLDRPNALNAISQTVQHQIMGILKKWQNDPTIKLVALKSSSPRAFSAGADLRELYELRQHGDEGPFKALQSYYRLFARIATFTKPTLSLMDGVAMGGGIGLGGHANIRIVTQHSVLAMPEVLIGLTPDAGGSWLLSRAPGFTGLRLALTAGRMTGHEAVSMGFADFLIPQEDLPNLVRALPHDGDYRLTVEKYAVTIQEPSLPQIQIDEIYGSGDVPTILKKLEQSPYTWAKSDLEAIAVASPLSLRIATEGYRRAAKAPDILSAMKEEENLIGKLLRYPDFAEGVRARVIDKDFTPRWQWPDIDHIPQREIDQIIG